MDEHIQHNKYEIDMSRGPLAGKILLYSVPLILTGLLQLLYGAVNIVVLGQYEGSVAVAAVGSTVSLTNLLINLFMGLAVGVSVAVAQNYGARDYEAVEETVHTAILLSLILGVCVAAIGFSAARTMLGLMGSPPDVIGLSTLYLRIYFLSSPAIMTYNFGAAILRSVGNTRQPLYYLSIAGVLNVALNLLFVIRLKVGIAGVATATLISQYVAAALIVACLMRTEGCLQLRLREMKLHADKVTAIFRIGLPAGLQSAIFSISNVLIQSSINSFGSVAMAGNAASSNLESFVYTAMNAVSQAALAFTGQNVGARKYTRVKDVLRICMALVLVVSLVMGWGFIALRESLLRIYLPNEPAAVAYGAQRLFVFCATYFLMGFIDVLVGAMRGMGYALAPVMVVLIGICGLRIVWLYTVFAAYRTLEVLYVSYPISWILTFLVELALLFGVYRRLLAQPGAGRARDRITGGC